MICGYRIRELILIALYFVVMLTATVSMLTWRVEIRDYLQGYSYGVRLRNCISHVSSYDINAIDPNVEDCVKQFNLRIDPTTGHWRVASK